jgi:hypothetical protein
MATIFPHRTLLLSLFLLYFLLYIFSVFFYTHMRNMVMRGRDGGTRDKKISFKVVGVEITASFLSGGL